MKIHSRLFQIIFYSVYIVLGSTGVIASYVGWLHDIHNEFFVFFTNQSNIIAVVCMICLLICAVKSFKQPFEKETHFVNFAFSVFIYQTITMILYNVLTPDGHIFTLKFWSTIQCPTLHLFAPLLYDAIFLIYIDKTKISKNIPLLVLIYPLIYSAYIFIRSFILGDVEPFPISGYVRFPYPIYDYVTYNPWLIVLFVVVGALGFAIVAFGLRWAFLKVSKKKD